MLYINNPRDYNGNAPSVVTIGKFDGIHKGHQKLFEQVNSYREQGYVSIVFTFNVQPASLISNNDISSIMTSEEMRRELENKNIDVLLECPFTEELMHMEPEAFLTEILIGRLHMKHLVVGTDFKMGYKGRGDTAFLKARESDSGYKLDVVPDQTYQGERISSTTIRSLITEGDLDTAAKLLGRYYYFDGVVVQGRHLGHELGFPTINIIPDPRKTMPPGGVYAAVCRLANGEVYNGAANIGRNPTIAPDNSTTLEMHLFDFEGELYDSKVEISLVHYIRPEQRFDSIEALREQLNNDMQQVREYFLYIANRL